MNGGIFNEKREDKHLRNCFDFNPHYRINTHFELLTGNCSHRKNRRTPTSYAYVFMSNRSNYWVYRI